MNSLCTLLRLAVVAAALAAPVIVLAGPSSLHMAAARGNLDRVDKLRAKGYDQNRPDPAGEYALHQAVYGDYATIVERLLDAGADVDQPDRRYGVSALSIAARFDRRAVATVLLDHGASTEFSREDAKAYDDGKRYAPMPVVMKHHVFAPALLAAIQSGSLPMIELLLARGANPEAVSSHGDTALVLAAKMGNTRVAEFLLGTGQPLNALAPNQQTPLLGAILLRREAMTRFLLEQGADRTASGPGRFAPIHSAAAWGDVAILNDVWHDDSDPNAQTADGRTPLHYAAGSGSLPAVEMLINNGADVHAKAKDGSTPLHHAGLEFSSGIAARLMQLGATPDEPPNRSKKEDEVASGYIHMLYADHLLVQGNAALAQAHYAQAASMIESAQQAFRKAAKAASRITTQAFLDQQGDILALSTGSMFERMAVLATTVGYAEDPNRTSDAALAQQRQIKMHAKEVQGLSKVWLKAINAKLACLNKGNTPAECAARG